MSNILFLIIRHCEEGGLPDEAISWLWRGLLQEEHLRNYGVQY